MFKEINILLFGNTVYIYFEKYLFSWIYPQGNIPNASIRFVQKSRSKVEFRNEMFKNEELLDILVDIFNKKLEKENLFYDYLKSSDLKNIEFLKTSSIRGEICKSIDGLTYYLKLKHGTKRIFFLQSQKDIIEPIIGIQTDMTLYSIDQREVISDDMNELTQFRYDSFVVLNLQDIKYRPATVYPEDMV